MAGSPSAAHPNVTEASGLLHSSTTAMRIRSNRPAHPLTHTLPPLSLVLTDLVPIPPPSGPRPLPSPIASRPPLRPIPRLHGRSHLHVHPRPTPVTYMLHSHIAAPLRLSRAASPPSPLPRRFPALPRFCPILCPTLAHVPSRCRAWPSFPFCRSSSPPLQILSAASLKGDKRILLIDETEISVIYFRAGSLPIPLAPLPLALIPLAPIPLAPLPSPSPPIPLAPIPLAPIPLAVSRPI